MSHAPVYEGTLDETEERPFDETATPQEWSQALREWAASHDPSTPPLSDYAVERESIYEGRGE